MRVGVYARVSTVGNGQSPDMQLADLRQLAQQRGFQIVREYVDNGVSGAKDSRPALDEMLADARRGKLDAILIWRMDRLGRSLQHLVRLFEDFRAWNVALISFSEGLDFSTSMGKLFYQLSGAFAEFERDCIRERVRAGMRHAKAKGVKFGPKRLAVNVEEMRRLRAEGQSIEAIAERMGLGFGTVYRALQRTAA